MNGHGDRGIYYQAEEAANLESSYRKRGTDEVDEAKTDDTVVKRLKLDLLSHSNMPHAQCSSRELRARFRYHWQVSLVAIAVGEGRQCRIHILHTHKAQAKRMFSTSHIYINRISKISNQAGSEMSRATALALGPLVIPTQVLRLRSKRCE